VPNEKGKTNEPENYAKDKIETVYTKGGSGEKGGR